MTLSLEVKRLALRCVVLGAILCSFYLGSGASAQEPGDDLQMLDIPAQSAEEAVKRLARASRRSVLFQTDDVKAVDTNALRGSYSLQGALDRMFEGTRLQGGLTESGAIIVSQRKAAIRSGGNESMQRRRTGFFLTTALSSVAATFSTASLAQDGTSPAAERDTIVVVGTQIKGADIAGELPVTVLDEEAIEATGDQTFEELLSNIPQAGGLDFNSGAELSNDTRGDIASLNLRTLGADTALVLVNGRRMVAHPQTQTFNGVPIQFVNMNAIPTTGLGRIEVLRDGASALYGSDAVAGVLNAVIRDDYEGLTGSVRYGFAEGADQDELTVRLFGGRSFNDGRTNVSFSAQYFDRTGLDASELDFTADSNHMFDPRLDPDDPFFGDSQLFNSSSFTQFGEFRAGFADNSADGIDGERVRRNGVSLTTGSGQFHLQPENFFPNPSQLGQPFSNGLEIDDGSFTSSSTSTGNGVVVNVNGEDFTVRPLHFNINSLRRLIPDTERWNFAGAVTHELTPSIEAFGDFIFFRSSSVKFFGPPVLSTSNNFVIPANYYWNPFGPEFLENGVTPNPNRLPDIDAPAEGLDIAVRRYRFEELGARDIDVDLSQWRALGGLRGELGLWNWESAFGYSRSKATDASLVVSRSALFAELSRTDPDAFNIFDGPGVTDVAGAEAAGFGVTVTRESVNTLATWDLRVSTPALFSAPGGDVGFGWGLEWRRESIDDDRDSRLDGSTPFTNPLTGEVFESDILGVSATADVAADRNIFSAYAETIVPVFTDTPAGSATLQAAGRLEHYTDIEDTVVKPRILATWEPTDWLSFRGAFSLGFRAPNLVQTTIPTFSRFTNFQEDWANCTFIEQSSGGGCDDFAITSNISGNPDLEPETSRNFSGGVVFRPTDSLLFTVDYWNIKVEGTVGTIPRNDQIALDEFLRRTQGSFNPNVVRDDPTQEQIDAVDAFNLENGTDIAAFGDILFVNETFLNLQDRRTAGFDFFGSWESPEWSFGGFRISANAALLTEYEQDPFAVLLPLLDDEIASDNLDASSFGDLRQIESRPKWRGSANARWRLDNITVGMNARYVGQVFDPDVTATLDDDSEIDFTVERWYRLDMYADYRIEADSFLDDTRLRFGIRNLTDNEPPLFDNSAGFSGRLHTITPRFFYFEARKRF